MSIPPYAAQILSRLEQAGYCAYAVGGCVRDSLLGRPANDWDITTSATPEQVQKIFEKTVPTGIAHGTVTVLLPDGGSEVTTFRTDGAYDDHRHPTQVRFSAALRDDLSRRDFTVNAMALDLRGTLYDEFGGRRDLDSKLLRCVGEPCKRFTEDALRMLRAVRFSAQLGFTVEPQTLAAIRSCAPLCEVLSAERVRDELKKTLLSERPEQISQMLALGLLRRFCLQSVPLEGLRTLPSEETVRWAGLKRCLPQLDLGALRLDRKTTQLATAAAAAAKLNMTRLQYKQLIAAQGEAVALCAASLVGERAQADEILHSGECVSLHQLAVTGADFPAVTGKQLGALLQQLLQHVLEHPQDNTRQTLLELAAKSI